MSYIASKYETAEILRLKGKIAAQEKTISRLLHAGGTTVQHLERLQDVARAVVRNWSHGDLAAAVRNLEANIES
jgi:uncharacterized coiled-coil protein SlyX